MTEAQLRERLANLDAALAAAVDLREAPGMTGTLTRLHTDRAQVLDELDGYAATLDGFPTTRQAQPGLERRSGPDGSRPGTAAAARTAPGFGDDDYGAAFEGYIRRGITSLPPEQAQLLNGAYSESRDWSTGTDAAGATPSRSCSSTSSPRR